MTFYADSETKIKPSSAQQIPHLLCVLQRRESTGVHTSGDTQSWAILSEGDMAPVVFQALVSSCLTLIPSSFPILDCALWRTLLSLCLLFPLAPSPQPGRRLCYLPLNNRPFPPHITCLLPGLSSLLCQEKESVLCLFCHLSCPLGPL